MAANDEAPPKSKPSFPPPPPPPGGKRRTGNNLPAAGGVPKPPLSKRAPVGKAAAEPSVPESKRSTDEMPALGAEPAPAAAKAAKPSRPLPDLKLRLKEGRSKAKANAKASAPSQPGRAKSPKRRARRPQPGAEARGNVVAPVAGEMLVSDPSDEDPTGVHQIPRSVHDQVDGAGEVDEDLRTLAVRSGDVALHVRAGAGVSNAVLEAYADEARAAIREFEAALEGETDEARVGRFHYEIARLCESVLGDLGRASAHYSRALKATPNRLPVVTGARRVMLARGECHEALQLFDRELRVTADRGAKAALMFLKARVLEDHLGKADEARTIYDSASELVASDAVLIKATEQSDWTLKDWSHLADTYARQANAVGSDARHRAAIVVRRARQLEVHRQDNDAAAQLYEDALDIDHRAPGALESLKRLHYDRRRWRELIRVLETEGEMAQDPAVRVMAQYRIGQIHAERLGNRKEAIAAFETAGREAPDQPFVLDALARLYEQGGAHTALANTLTRLVESTTDARERLGYLHRIGELSRHELHDDEAAIAAYEAALEIDPTYVPALRSLAPMYSRKEKWDLLVQMHEREAEATDDPARRGVAHARAAEILERAGRRVEAIAHHERALTLDPGLASSFRALLRLYAVTEDHHKLVELYERALDHVDAQRRVEYLFSVGDLYRGPLADPPLAEAAYLRILKIDAKHLGAVHALQRTAEAAGRWRQLVDALEMETRIISDRKEIVALLYRAGSVLQEHLGSRSEAVSCFKRVLEINAAHQPTLASLGRIHHADGHWADLVDVYERELPICDASSKVALLHKMGDVYSRFLADSPKAIACFRKALTIEPRHAPSAHALARILTDRGEWSALVELTEKEQRQAKDPSSQAVAAFRAGEIYEERLDDKASAERAFTTAAELRPDDESAAEALARVRTQLSHWKALGVELEDRAERSEDRARAIGLLLRAAEVWFDHVDSVDASIKCYEKVLALRADHVGALLGIEPLYRRAELWAKLADIYARQVHVFSDPGAKAAALTERARVLELHSVGVPADLVDCYMAILAFRPADRSVLEGLERIAMSSNDPRILSDVDARLADAVADPELKSAYLTRQAEAMEVSGQPQALDVYRSALRQDSANRGAVRGLARVAEVIGHGKAMVEAAEAEAALARLPSDAADAWVRSGVVRVDRLGDRAAAIAAFEKALAQWPDHTEAAERLSALMTRNGSFEVLVERLSRAASEAAQPPRQHALWAEVARIHVDELNNLGAGLSALRKLVELQPTNGEALFDLGALLHSDRRFEESIDLLNAALEADPDAPIAQRSHALLAASHEALGDTARASRHYEAALELAPDDHELLQRVVNLQMADDAFERATETALRLVQVARNDGERCRSLVLLSKAQHSAGNLEIALAHLAEAVAIEGPRGRARAEVARIATESEHWDGYVQALRKQIERRGTEGEGAGALFLEVARVQIDKLSAAEDGMNTLADGLRQCGSSSPLRYALAEELRKAKRPIEAVEQFQYLLMEEVDRADAWRALAETHGSVGNVRQQHMALASVAVLGDATPAEAAALQSWRPLTRALGPGVLRDEVLAELFVARAQQAPMYGLIGALAEGLGRLRAPDLSRYGVSGRDKLAARAEHPVRGIVDRLALSFGIEEFDLYIHNVPDLPAVIENTPRPSLVVPKWIGDLPPAGRVFMLSHALFMLSRGLYPIDLFSTRELEELLAASARNAVPSYGQRVASGEVLDEKLRLIHKGLPRRKRRGFEAAAETYARAQPLDVNTAVQWCKQTARRVALLAADDLAGSLQALSRMEEFGGLSGRELVATNPVVGDLLKVWVSKPAMTVRRRLGLLPVPQGTQVSPPPPPR